jgi:hypothetical protein
MTSIDLQQPKILQSTSEHHPFEPQGLSKRLHRRAKSLGPQVHPQRALWITGVILLLGQLIAMCTWSTILWSRFSLTSDYAQYHQAWWLISHGDLDPISNFFAIGSPFWQNNFELFMWPLALTGVLFSHGPTLLFLQDISLFGAEATAWAWIMEAASSISAKKFALLLGITGLVLLLANPWAWVSISFDFHMELISILFITLAAWDLCHQRARGWVWVFLALLCGDQSAAWVVGLGAGLVLTNPRKWPTGAKVITVGISYLFISALVHGDLGGNPVGLYGYLANGHAKSLGQLLETLFFHPTRLVGALWSHRLNTFANLAPGGLIGILDPIALGVGLVGLGSVDLTRGNIFSQPLFQNVELYVLVPLGSILVLCWLWRKAPRLSVGISSVLAANAIVWSLVFLPTWPATWLRVSTPTASRLSKIQKEIPPHSEVIASQGIIGRFTDRRFAFSLVAPRERIPIESRDTWWIITPHQGTELMPTADQQELIYDLVSNLGARLVSHRDGVWLFHWIAPRKTRYVMTPAVPNGLPGWLLAGPSGQSITKGPLSNWAAEANGKKGYVLSGDYFRVPTGNYTALVTLASSVPVNVEVWNNSAYSTKKAAVLLARKRILPTNGYRTIQLSISLTKPYPHRLWNGWGPFRIAIPPRPKGQRLEIRVWTPGGGITRVTWVSLQKKGETHAS